MSKEPRIRKGKQSVKGVIAFSFSILSALVLITGVIASSRSAGQSGLWLGGVGLLILVSNVIGLVLAIQALKEREVSVRMPMVAIGGNGVLLVVMVCIYIIGF